MSTPATGAKYVVAVVVGVVGAGTFAGVSHDGRGGAAPPDPEPIAVAPPTSPSSTVPSSTVPSSTVPSSTVPSSTTSDGVASTLPALPAAPDPDPTRTRVRSRGS